MRRDWTINTSTARRRALALLLASAAIAACPRRSLLVTAGLSHGDGDIFLTRHGWASVELLAPMPERHGVDRLAALMS